MSRFWILCECVVQLKMHLKCMNELSKLHGNLPIDCHLKWWSGPSRWKRLAAPSEVSLGPGEQQLDDSEVKFYLTAIVKRK